MIEGRDVTKSHWAQSLLCVKGLRLQKATTKKQIASWQRRGLKPFVLLATVSLLAKELSLREQHLRQGGWLKGWEGEETEWGALESMGEGLAAA